MAVYILLSLIRLRRTVTGAVRLQDRIYLADHIASPFVAGVFRPKIYLPSSLSVQERQYILLHEQAHIRRFDPLFRVLAFIALSLHWFNPLVWAAFYLSGRDMEMACDETVMRQMENDIRREYAQSLLDRTTGKRIAPGIPLAFGETNIKARIRNIMSYRKSSRWVIAAAVVVLAALCIGLALNPAKSQRAAITFPLIRTESQNITKASTIFARLRFISISRRDGLPLFPHRKKEAPPLPALRLFI